MIKDRTFMVFSRSHRSTLLPLGLKNRLASDARTSLARVEASESADFNLISGSQGTDDAAV
jgi:hypothetical protein